MDLITRRVIERLENGNVTDEVLQEYTDPDSEKYEKMVDEICKELHFTSLRFNRLDDMLEACGVEKCKLCTYCWMVRSKLRMTAMLYATDSIIYKIINL